VRLYTRRGCHLCATAWECLRRAQRRRRFTLTVVDVDTDPDLVARYGDCVPVVTVNDKVRFRGVVNPVLLARLLDAEPGRRSGSRPDEKSSRAGKSELKTDLGESGL
jgi:glutaredoxin